MIDYHGNRVALSAFMSSLAAANFSGTTVTKAQQEALAAVKAEGGCALLGAFVHHLLGHAASDGAELDLLERATHLWSRGAVLASQLGAIRTDLEGALENPGATGSTDRFNAAAVAAQDFADTANELRVAIDALRSDVLAFPHLPPHPRQQDRKTNTWDWGNLAPARRTDAFVRTLFRMADNLGSTAFAVGAATSYGANVAGSAYIGRSVGGPRRMHRYRHRIARNAVGSWLASHHPAAVSTAAMASAISFGDAENPTLPTELESLLHDALRGTFDLNRTGPVPDLQRGYRRLIRHLTLLDGFNRSPVPTPPAQNWMVALYGDPQNPPPSLRPQDIDVGGQDGGGVAVVYGSPAPGSSSPNGSDSSTASKGCEIAFLILILIDLAQAFVQCIVQWGKKETCTYWDNMLLKKLWEQDPPDPRDPTQPQDVNTTTAQLTAIASSPQAAQLVGMLFDAHCQIWEAMDRAYAFLAVTGLIYPGNLVTLPLYAQFTSLPGIQSWPHREEANPAKTYHLSPISRLELPKTSPSPFPIGAHPDVYLGQFHGPNATQVTLQLWQQSVAGLFDSQNLDLDADRGFMHPCWAAHGSVHNQPVDVVVLGYSEQ